MDSGHIASSTNLGNGVVLVLRIAKQKIVQCELCRSRIYELLQGIPASAISGNAVLKTPTGL